MKKSFRRIAILILQIIFAICVFALAACSGSCSSCSSCNKDIGNPEMPDNVTTTRKPVPADGSKPTEHRGADTIAYLAYVLDNQPYYHAYAYNSTRAMAGYEQITQTWKDYKNAELSGKNVGIMIASDISYSTFAKSATQSCFVDSNNDKGDAVYMRNGSRPSKDSTAINTEWSTDSPSYYSRKDYLTTYGEFSTELTVYAINADTIESTGEVIDNGDGTYSLNAKLKPDAACWYQYGMKTRGGFKSFPVYHKIELTFTFDAQWQVLTVNCEESATISPSALGGMDMSSNSKTTATYDYSEGGFDNVHFAYLPEYFDKYIGEVIFDDPKQEEPDLTDVLAGGFSKVLSEDGQQFGLSLTIGETEYDGNLFLNVENLEISNLDVRLSLGKKDGAQDLYVEYKGGNVNAYYSDGFAATADISKVAGSVTRFADWVKATFGSEEDEPAVQAEGESSGIDLEGLLTLLSDGFGFDETSAWIVLKTDDLLGLGIGIDAHLDFWREITEDNKNNYGFTGLQLSEISYKGEKIKVSGQILPDDGETISHNPAEAPADIADYIDGVLNLVNGGKFGVSIDFDGTVMDIEYIENVKLQADALINLSEDYKTVYVSVPVAASYSGLTVELTAYYTIDFAEGGYGTVYLNLTNIGGQDTDVKVYCDIADAKASVEQLINGVQSFSEEENASDTIATVINKVLSLDFGAIVKEIKGNSEKLELGIGVDEILNALEIDPGIEIGTVTLSLGLNEGKASLNGSIPALGVSLGAVSSEDTVSMPDSAEYLNVADYIEGVYELISSSVYEVRLSLVNSDLKLILNTTALVQPENNFNNITVFAPVSVKLGNNSISLTVYYNIDLSDEGYGKVYLSVDSINGKPADAKIYCDIMNAVNTVNEIIALFDKNNGGGAGAQSEESEKIADIISKVVSINYATLIEQLKADASGLNVCVNADYLLGELGVSLGKDLTLGMLSLSVTADEDKNIILSGGLESLGADITVKASGDSIEDIDPDEYANAEEYLKGAYRLIEGVNYSVSLDFDGSAIDNEYIENVKLNGTALISLSEDYSALYVKLPLTVSYSDLAVKLTAYYTIGFNDGNYGTVYLNVYEIGNKNGKTTVDVNVYGDISETKASVEQLINYFNGISTQSDGGKAGAIANIIDTVISLDFGAVIKEIKANSDKIYLSIGADEVLSVLEVNLGVEIGTVDLDLAFVDGELTLGGKAASLGLTVGVAGSTVVVSMPDPDEYANAAEYIDGVYNLLQSTAYGVELTVKETGLGLDIHSTAFVAVDNNFNDITVYAPVTVTYGNYNVGLSVYYTVSLADENYGKVFLSVDTIGDDAIGAKVYCDISETVDAVYAIIAMFDKKGNTPVMQSAGGNTVAEIIAKVVAIDYAKLILQLKADGSGLDVSVNADELLAVVGVAAGKDIKAGNVSLNLTLDKKNTAVLRAGLDGLNAYGLSVNGSVSVKASDDTVTIPGEEGYFDLNELLTVVRKAIGEAQAIIDGNDVEFTFDAALTVDGVKMEIANAYGEVEWSDGIRVAVSADLIISEGEGEDSSQTLKLRIVYDENNKESETKPLVTLSVNDYGLTIYSKDIDDTDKGIQEIVKKIKYIAGKFRTEGTAEESQPEDGPAMQGEEGEKAEDKTGLDKVLDIVFTQISNLTVELAEAEGESKVAQLVISYLENATLTLDANGGLSLGLKVQNDNETEILSLHASVRAKGENEDKFEKVSEDFANVTFYTASEKGSFVKAVYEYVRDVFESLTIKNLLKDNTYEVRLDLYGAKSGIDVLENIDVHATVKYTDSAVFKNSTDAGTKLAEINAVLNINGTDVNLSAIYFRNSIYVTVYNVGGTALYSSDNVAGIKITASTDNICKVVESVISIIKNKNFNAILDIIKPDTNGTSAQSDEENEIIPDKKTEYALTDILNALFTLEIRFGKSEDGTQNTLTVNIDKALKSFGLDFEIGTVNVAVNPKTHDIVANVSKVTANEEGEPENVNWITLTAQTVKNATALEFDNTDYIDIGFVANLVDDVNTTLDNMTTKETVDGETAENTDLRLSFYGTIDIPIKVVGLQLSDVEFKQATLTVGFDEDNEFYVSLKAQVQSSLLVINNTRFVSLTYSNGYITLGRDVDDSSKAIYKVMTFDYLIDNLLVEGNDAPLRWWLDIKTGIWNQIASRVNLNLSSSLTKTDEYYVFDPSLHKVEDETAEKIFILSDLIKAIIVDGVNVYNSSSDIISKLGLGNSKNYYAFDINGEKLLGGTLPTAYIALMHSDTEGINGLMAYASVAGYLFPTIKLSSLAASHAPNYFKTVTAVHTDINFTYEVKQEKYTDIFGCYNTEDRTYSYSKKYSDVKLTVLDEQGNIIAGKTLKYGSNVYVVKEIVYSADGETRNIYLDANGNDVTTREFATTNEAGEKTVIGYGFCITADTVIQPATVGKSKVIYHADGQTREGASKFVGEQLDDCAVTVNGKTFAGWYLENTFETYTVSVCANKQDYYAKFVDATVTAANGVIYGFNYSFATGGYYHATGFNKNSADKDYSDGNNTLIIPDKIDGYPVTRIEKDAFKDESNSGMIKNIVAGRNVTEVGAQAFMDNKYMLSAVFLADYVKFEGSAYGGNERYPFLGCGNGDTTNASLNIYYNTTAEGTPDNWMGFKKGNNDDKGTNLPDSQLHAAGAWTYVEFDFDGAIPENCNYTLEQLGINGFVSTAETYDFAEIETTVERNLNELLKADGAPMLYAYNIVISGGYGLGSVVTMRVSYENVSDASEIRYRLTLVSTDLNCSVTPSAEGMIETETEGVFYVKAGDKVTFNLNHSNSYKLKEYITDVNDLAVENNTLTMPDSAVQVDVYWEFNKAERTFIHSEVDFVYGSKNYFAGNLVQLTNAALGEQLNSVTAYDNPATEADESAMYTFVGWGVRTEGENLQFASVTLPETEENDVTYYAIWVENREGKTGYSLNTSGNIPMEAGVEGWYTDSTFGTKIEAITTEYTKLYARLTYSFNVNLSAGDTTWYYSYRKGSCGKVTDYDITVDKKVVSGYTKVIGENSCTFSAEKGLKDIVEGYSVNVYSCWDNALIIKVYDEKNALVETYMVKGIKTKANDIRTVYYYEPAVTGTFLGLGDKAEVKHPVTFNQGTWYNCETKLELGTEYTQNDISNSETVDECSALIIGKTTNVKGGLEFTVKG